jgi:hypothetical protein
MSALVKNKGITNNSMMVATVPATIRPQGHLRIAMVCPRGLSGGC